MVTKRSVGFSLIVAAIALLSSGIAYILLNQTLTNYLLNETLVTQIVSTMPYGNMTQVEAVQATVSTWFAAVPILICIFIVLYLIINAQAGRQQ